MLNRFRITGVTLAMTAVLAGCAVNKAARNAALQIGASMTLHDQSLNAKIEEQQKFYDARRDAISAAQRADNDDQLMLARRSSAARFATDLSDDPARTARISPLVEFLNKSVQDEFDRYRQQRAAELESINAYDAALEAVARQKAALASARNSVNRLTAKATRKEQMQAILDFAAELNELIKKQDAKK